MTNKEKFKEVFGFTPFLPLITYNGIKVIEHKEKTMCPLPEKVCNSLENDSDESCTCEDCPFDDWWDKEYKPCFSLREDLNE